MTPSMLFLCSPFPSSILFCAIFYVSTGTYSCCRVALFYTACSCVRSPSFSLMSVVFIGMSVCWVSLLSCWVSFLSVSRLSVGILSVFGICYVCTFSSILLYHYYWAAMSIIAFFTAYTMGVKAVALSRFSMYLNLFLWFSTLKFTPPTISRKSIAFYSVVCITSCSSSASESSESAFPIFFLFPCLLRLGSLLKAASCAAPKMNVNLVFSSVANYLKSSPSSMQFVCRVGRAVGCYCSLCYSSNRCSISSILLDSLASTVFSSN